MAGHLYSQKNASVEKHFHRAGFESLYADDAEDFTESSSDSESESSDSDHDVDGGTDEPRHPDNPNQNPRGPTLDTKTARRRAMKLILPTGATPSWVLSKSAKMQVNRNLRVRYPTVP